jgi:transcriptional regulator with XRE-family HTH domain
VPLKHKFHAYNAAYLAASLIPSAAETRARLILARKEHNLSRGQLALLLCTSPRNVEAWELGLRNAGPLARLWIARTLADLNTEQRRKTRRHRQYERRKGRTLDLTGKEAAILATDGSTSAMPLDSDATKS